MALFNGVETRPSVGELLIRTLNCRLMPDRRPEKMAQGQKKKKGISAKKSGSKRPLGPKKGARTIAPKKAKNVRAAKVKKGLERAIKAKIEKEVIQAASKEAKPFSVVKPSVDEDKQKRNPDKQKRNLGKQKKKGH